MAVPARKLEGEQASGRQALARPRGRVLLSIVAERLVILARTGIHRRLTWLQLRLYNSRMRRDAEELEVRAAARRSIADGSAVKGVTSRAELVRMMEDRRSSRP